MTAKGIPNRILRPLGLELGRYHPAAGRRQSLLQQYSIQTVLDVGANTGQYGKQLRRGGFRGAIHSFEPLTAAFEVLAGATAKDTNWFCHKVALGAASGFEDIRLASNIASSSLLASNTTLRAAAPHITFTGRERVAIERLDAFPAVACSISPFYLKVDVQGTELDVILGASGILDRVTLLEMELSIEPLYEGSPALADALNAVREHGFVLKSLSPIFRSQATSDWVQYDGIFEHVVPGSFRKS